jgi:glycosyltransferase involved in cell wall biosynthesis
MAMGIPVIATAVGGTPEIIVHAETGLLVPAHQPAAIAGAVQRLLNDPELAKRCAENARRVVVEDFSIDRVVAMTDALYRRLTDGGATGGHVV